MINVFVKDLTPRIEYAFELVFGTILNSKVIFHTRANSFEVAGRVKINYSEKHFPDCLNLIPHSLLLSAKLKKIKPKKIMWDNLPALFPVEKSFLPFDIFAATFFLVSRYEEYFYENLDKHGRFDPFGSVAAQYNFLEKPLVNLWAIKMAEAIRQNDLDFLYDKPCFQYLPTFDIDNAWAFKNKSVVRLFLSSAKDVVYGRWHSLKKRVKVISGFQPDPYDNYDFILNEIALHKFNPIFFFLLRSRGKFDRALSPKNRKFKKLIRRLAEFGEVGIHPSYYSNSNKKALQHEITLLSDITSKDITCSRQHFLMLHFPSTYQNLIQNNIEVDYSMGYPDCVGFRASLATPFRFFDIEQNKTTNLKIVPFQIMDVTLKHYMNLSISQTLKKIELLMLETARVGGTFVSLWHNESLGQSKSDHKCRFIYAEMSRLAAKLQNEAKGETDLSKPASL